MLMQFFNKQTFSFKDSITILVKKCFRISKNHHYSFDILFRFDKGQKELQHLHNKISLAIIRSQSGLDIGKASPHESGTKNYKTSILLIIMINIKEPQFSLWFSPTETELTPYVWNDRSNSIYPAIIHYILFDLSIIIVGRRDVKLKRFSQENGQSSSATENELRNEKTLTQTKPILSRSKISSSEPQKRIHAELVQNIFLKLSIYWFKFS